MQLYPKRIKWTKASKDTRPRPHRIRAVNVLPGWVLKSTACIKYFGVQLEDKQKAPRARKHSGAATGRLVPI